MICVQRAIDPTTPVCSYLDIKNAYQFFEDDVSTLLEDTQLLLQYCFTNYFPGIKNKVTAYDDITA